MKQMPDLVPLDQITNNPFRDLKLHPIDDEQIAGLVNSIRDHGFFASLKGRRRNGKVELGCGHSRVAAARQAKITSVPIYLDDLDDSAMVQLMTVENALQHGANPGAVMNEVASVTRLLIEDLIRQGQRVPVTLTLAFDDERAIDVARRRVEACRTKPNADVPVSHNVIMRYLGNGDPKKSPRAERQVREAIAALKQSGIYDRIVDGAVRKYPQPVNGKPASSEREIATVPQPKVPRRILDEQTAHLFPNEHQFSAFRDAVTSSAAQKVIPVNQQFALAKEIMDPASRKDFNKKQVGAPHIRMMVQEKVKEGLKKQREIDKEERDRYFAEQREAQVDAELHSALASVRSLMSALVKLERLSKEFPSHPKIVRFAERLQELNNMISKFAKTLK
jgi:hypothetical protein